MRQPSLDVQPFAPTLAVVAIVVSVPPASAPGSGDEPILLEDELAASPLRCAGMPSVAAVRHREKVPEVLLLPLQ